jgi:hypothetical protein
LTPDLLDPRVVISAVVAILGILWRLHMKADHDMETDRNFWRSIALTGVDVADKSTTIAVRKRDG